LAAADSQRSPAAGGDVTSAGRVSGAGAPVADGAPEEGCAVFRAWKKLAIVMLIAVAGLGGYVYNRLTSLRYDRLTDDVFVIYGLGGNVGVLRSDAGTVVVDTMTFPVQGKRIRAMAEKITGKPVRIVVNTHYHPDHSHGNPAFDEATEIVTTEQTRKNLLVRDARFWQGANAVGLPDTTFVDHHALALGNKTVRLIHPGRGHTDGDLVALFVEDRVLHMGDLYFNKRYPNIDLEAGGSIAEWIVTLDQVFEHEFDIVIPGHGEVTNPAGIRAFQTFLRDLAAVGQEAAEQGLTLEQTLARPSLQLYADFDSLEVPFVLKLDRDFVVKRSWEEATGSFTYVPAELP
jgi:cyclase